MCRSTVGSGSGRSGSPGRGRPWEDMRPNVGKRFSPRQEQVGEVTAGPAPVSPHGGFPFDGFGAAPCDLVRLSRRVLLAPLPGLGVVPGMAAGMAAASAATLRLPVSCVVLVVLVVGYSETVPVIVLAAVVAFVTTELLPRGPGYPGVQCEARSSASSSVVAAMMRERWVKAWGKLPSCSPLGPISSANRPTWFAYVCIFSKV